MFEKTKIKLTVSYVVGIMAITLLFSSFIYVGLNRATQRALDLHERRVEMRLREFPRGPMIPDRFQAPYTQETITQIEHSTLSVLLAVNLGALLLAATVGYWFAHRTLKPIKISMDNQKKFIADAAHELKTPITSIKTALEVALRNKNQDKEGFKEVIKEAISDIDELNLHINQLLQQSKLENLILNKTKTIFRLDNVIQETVSKLNSRISEKNIELKTKLDDVSVFADKKSIVELVTILLDNAIKFNKDGGQIQITLVTSKNYAVLKIKDSGIGIDEKEQGLIFNRFYKSNVSRSKTNNDGMGLGLSIAQEIINTNNGTISVKSKKGEGSTFIVNLPIKKS